MKRVKRMNRPPKKWFYHHLKLAQREPRISDPKRFVGWLWYHHLTPKQKIKNLTKKDLQRELLKYYTSGVLGNCKKTAELTYGKSRMKKRAKKHRTKKHPSKKQLAALRKGRKVLSYIRTGRKVAEDKEPLIIKEGSLMAGKKKGRKGKRVKHVVYGFEGTEGTKKRGRGKKRGHGSYMHGAGKGFDALGLLTDLTGLLSGAIVGAFAGKIIPIQKLWVKSLGPVALGVAGVSIPQVSRIRFVNRMALGSLLVGGGGIIKNFWPAMPMLSGETAETVAAAIDGLGEEERAILGLLPAPETAGEEDEDGMGEATETAGYEDEIQGLDAPRSPASIA